MALGLLGVSVWRLRPAPKPPEFSTLLAQATGLKQASLYEEASKYTETLLADPARTPDQSIALHGLLAEVIFEHESSNTVHGPTNCRRILEHSNQALPANQSYTAGQRRMRALAHEWLGQTPAAIEEYNQALAAGIENPWHLRQHIIQLQHLLGELTPAQTHQEMDGFLAATGVPVELQFWAAEQKIQLFVADGKHDAAEKFIADHTGRFDNTTWKNGLDYLRGLTWYHLGRHDEAERLLRNLRSQILPGDPLYAQTGWVLGSILQKQGTPESALSFFDEVLEKTPPTPSRTACLLGRAECLADLEQFDASLQAFAEVVRIASEEPLVAQLDLKDVRDSVTAWYQALYLAGQRSRAMDFLRLAAKLAPPSDGALQIVYSRRMADLGFELGKTRTSVKSATTAPADLDAPTARRYLTEAGDEYLRLGKLSNTDPQVPMEAMWQAAEAFDLAGARQEMIEVLEAFVREYPESVRVPEAILQLGRAYQSSGNLAKAVENYQENLISFPRTPAALASLIPLADCFLELKAPDKAEQTLLRVVTPRPGDELALITPDAPEYRNAIFRLGDLYMHGEQYEKAIARYEEALDRYGTDPRADFASFNLAEACRKSAAQIRKNLGDPKHMAFRESLESMCQQRLQRAHQMFDQVIERYQARPPEALNEVDRLSLKLSHLYSADAVYDLSLLGGGSEPFARSLTLYEKAAWAYQREPIAMSAYVQIINCYLHLGKVSQAWMALQRARWALRNIPDDAFLQYAPEQGREYWENYLTWLEKKPTFATLAG